MCNSIDWIDGNDGFLYHKGPFEYNFEQAKSYCQSYLKVDLAMPKTNQQYDVLKSIMNPGEHFWIGITNIQNNCANIQDCKFNWIDGTLFQYQEFLHNHFQVQFLKTDLMENCGSADNIAPTNIQIYNRNCDLNQKPLCQKDPIGRLIPFR